MTLQSTQLTKLQSCAALMGVCAGVLAYFISIHYVVRPLVGEGFTLALFAIVGLVAAIIGGGLLGARLAGASIPLPSFREIALPSFREIAFGCGCVFLFVFGLVLLGMAFGSGEWVHAAISRNNPDWSKRSVERCTLAVVIGVPALVWSLVAEGLQRLHRRVFGRDVAGDPADGVPTDGGGS